ncbi:unnamed protein product [Nippostrongylus brasiliensis]|uniref:DUF1778 domain-containing protein n=1 Tax=Nippostrongylus brasiliensis TaxID=27835 RepID=A0A0N4YYV8_NIPBR|nr:unnamed protein product [Nippostrongylus brasiliensis]
MPASIHLQNARDVVPPLPLQRFVEDSFHLAPPRVLSRSYRKSQLRHRFRW